MEYIAAPFIMIVFLMLSMAGILYLRWKTRMYIFFLIALVLNIVPYILWGLHLIRPYGVLFLSLAGLGYSAMQVGIFQLFRPKDKKGFLITSSVLGVYIIISLLSHLIGAAGIIVVGIALLGISAFYFMWFGEPWKYKASLISFSLTVLLQVVNEFVTSTWLTWISLAFLIIFHYFIFITFFERIIDILQAIQYSSVTDGLTGLFNRKYFNRKVVQAIDSGIQPAVIFSDIDNFKKLNDTQGHQVGDEMLRAVANIMKEELEGIGLAGRYGGEEMVGLILDESIDPEEICERIRSRVQNETIVTVSMGYSRYMNNLSAEEFVKQADDAMYYSKTTGKNRVTAYEEISKG